jgi:hypothetical protein
LCILFYDNKGDPMKKHRFFGAWAMVIGLFLGITLINGQALAAGTMGEVLNELAALLNMPSADVIALLYPEGFNGTAKATEGNISQLYLAVNDAVIGGQLSGNAANLITNAAGKAGVPPDTITAGITTGTALSAAAGSRRGGEGDGRGNRGGEGEGRGNRGGEGRDFRGGEGRGFHGGEGGGGGGGAVSPSR